jgi:cytochrome c553
VRNKFVPRVIIGLVVGLLILGLAIYGVSAISRPSPIEEGKALFAEKGCIACHGPDALGTENGPALPGHTAEQVRRQVREPLSQMIRFTEEQVSDAELEKLVVYITSLAPPEAAAAMPEHEHDMSTPAQAHLWMALTAFEADNSADTHHHLQHAIEVADEAQVEAIQAMLDNLDGGDVHAIQHEMETVLAETQALEKKGLRELHLELALSAIEAREMEDARHHVEHFIEAGNKMDKLKGDQLLAFMDGRDFHEARHGIEGLLGMATHGDH